MNNIVRAIMEIFGRGCITLLAVVAINRTSWYQSFPGQIPLTNPYAWLISMGVLGCLFWLLVPGLDYISEYHYDVNHAKSEGLL